MSLSQETTLRPLVSICIPSYNKSKFIIETLNSILADNYPNKEIIIIDDSSTDNSVELIQNWIQTCTCPIKLEVHAQNSGITKTINDTIKLSQGEYITIIAADDNFIPPDSLESRVNYLQAHSEKYAVVSDYHRIDENSNLIQSHYLRTVRRRNSLSELNTDQKLRRFFIHNLGAFGPTLMLKRSIFPVIGWFDESFRDSEDIDYFLRMIAVDALGYLDKATAAYRFYVGNSIRAASKQQTSLRQQINLAMLKNRYQFNIADKCLLDYILLVITLKNTLRPIYKTIKQIINYIK